MSHAQVGKWRPSLLCCADHIFGSSSLEPKLFSPLSTPKSFFQQSTRKPGKTPATLPPHYLSWMMLVQEPILLESISKVRGIQCGCYMSGALLANATSTHTEGVRLWQTSLLSLPR